MTLCVTNRCMTAARSRELPDRKRALRDTCNLTLRNYAGLRKFDDYVLTKMINLQNLAHSALEWNKALPHLASVPHLAPKKAPSQAMTLAQSASSELDEVQHSGGNEHAPLLSEERRQQIQEWTIRKSRIGKAALWFCSMMKHTIPNYHRHRLHHRRIVYQHVPERSHQSRYSLL